MTPCTCSFLVLYLAALSKRLPVQGTNALDSVGFARAQVPDRFAVHISAKKGEIEDDKSRFFLARPEAVQRKCGTIGTCMSRRGGSITQMGQRGKEGGGRRAMGSMRSSNDDGETVDDIEEDAERVGEETKSMSRGTSLVINMDSKKKEKKKKTKSTSEESDRGVAFRFRAAISIDRYGRPVAIRIGGWNEMVSTNGGHPRVSWWRLSLWSRFFIAGRPPMIGTEALTLLSQGSMPTQQRRGYGLRKDRRAPAIRGRWRKKQPQARGVAR
ncbi:hypothetical protein EDB84DRAFT_1434975 [Lactarius hengduanensis]|nr:hypothetical protein EDB84DRAFT_1434975 [Lactarius hengduanensis]